MNTEVTLPKEVMAVFTEIKSVFPSAVIAGGALRDLHYGKAPKDFDIFIPETEDEFKQHSVGLMQAAFPEAKAQGAPLEPTQQEEVSSSSGTTVLSSIRSIYGVYELKRDGFEFDIIFGDTRAADINLFDFSFNQIACDGKTVWYTAAYEETYRTRVVTVIRSPQTELQEDRFRDRFKRFAKKFPELKFRDTFNRVVRYRDISRIDDFDPLAIPLKKVADEYDPF